MSRSDFFLPYAYTPNLRAESGAAQKRVHKLAKRLQTVKAKLNSLYKTPGKAVLEIEPAGQAEKQS